MLKRLAVLIVSAILLITVSPVMAVNEPCDPTDNLPNNGCDAVLFCNPAPGGNKNQGSCAERFKQSVRCNPTDNLPNNGCASTLFCKPAPGGNKTDGSCEVGFSSQGLIGKIKAPTPLQKLLEKDPTGAGAISDFLSRFITLLYIMASIVLVFMILWGAFDWLTSGGDKEKLASAQRKLINAFIGILLFAVAFAVISVLGAFTGFRFFQGQGITPIYDASGKFIVSYRCRNGETVVAFGKDPETACKGKN